MQRTQNSQNNIEKEKMRELMFSNFKTYYREFPGGPVVRTLCFHCRGHGSIHGWGTKILQAMQQGQKKKKTYYKDTVIKTM